MKSFREWKEEDTRDENPVLLLKNLSQLAKMLESELKEYKGERFQGFIEMIGAINSLRMTLAEIDTGAFAPGWMTNEAGEDSKPTAPHGMQKISSEEKKSKGSRDIRDDLSGDYKGHIKQNGTVDPFKLNK